MRIGVKLACTCIVFVLAGCSTISKMFSGDPPRNPPAALTDFKPTMSVHTAWSLSIGSANNFVFSPALSGDSLFLASADGSIARVDATSGRTQWRINAGTSLTAGVGNDGKMIAVAGAKGVVMAFDTDGKLLWKAQASSDVLSAPAVGQGLVIVRSVDNNITAFDADSGTRRWVIQRTAPSLTLRTAPSIVIAGPLAFVPLPGGKLLAVTLNNGGPLWEATVGEPRGATELDRIADTSGLVVAGREVCAVTYQGRVGCFDAINGGQRWVKKLSSDVGLAMDERFVFTADERGEVDAFTRDTGTSVWSNKVLANRGLSTPVSFERAVAVGDYQGYIHFMSREDGALLVRVATDGSAIIATPVVAGSNVIFQTQSGTVIALATE